MDVVTKRNFTGLSEGLKNQRDRINELETKLDMATEQTTQLRAELAELRRQVAILHAKVGGNGATKR